MASSLTMNSPTKSPTLMNNASTIIGQNVVTCDTLLSRLSNDNTFKYNTPVINKTYTDQLKNISNVFKQSENPNTDINQSESAKKYLNQSNVTNNEVSQSDVSSNEDSQPTVAISDVDQSTATVHDVDQSTAPDNGSPNQIEDFHAIMTLTGRLRYFSEHFSNKEAFVFHNSTNTRTSLSWKHLFNLAGRFAWRLHQQGFRRYDVIANTLPNSPERVVTDLGIIFAGCTLMNGQILRSDGADFHQSAQVSACKAVVTWPREEEPAWKLFRNHVIDDNADVTGNASRLFVPMACEQTPAMTHLILVSRQQKGPGYPLIEELTSGDDPTYVADLEPDDVMTVFTTSGSTGFSKLVPRTHRWLMRHYGERPDARSQSVFKVANDGVYCDRPLGWLGGFPVTTYAKAHRRVMLDCADVPDNDDLRAALSWRAICQEGCRVVTLLPREFYKLLAHVEALEGGQCHCEGSDKGQCHFRPDVMTMGGQPITQSQISDFLKLCSSVFVTYGSTESGIVTAAVLTDATSADYMCGKPFASGIVRIVNKDMVDCRPGEMGTVWVKGEGVFHRYFNQVDQNDENTRNAFTSDGWFNTADNGYWGDQGNLYVIGRQNDVITHGGFCVYPGWLENTLMTHPDVDDVVVVPVSDPVLFHNICACVQPAKGKNLTEESLRDFADSMFLTDSEAETTPTPKYYLTMEHFPETSTGKPNKPLLKKMAEERFGQAKP